MTARLIHQWALTASAILGLAFATIGLADDGVIAEIRGSEELHNLVILSPTTNAPTDATGVILIEAQDQNGTVVARADVQLQALAPDSYTISVTKKSETNATVVVGTFTVTPTVSHCIFSLPADLSPLDIAAIAVAGSDGTVKLTGDLTDGAAVLNGLFKAKMTVVGGAAAPGASGVVYARSKTANGTRTTRFKLFATGAIPNATLTLKINGVDYGTVNTDPRGNLKLQKLPDGLDLENIQEIDLDDPDGTNALSVTF